MSKAIVYFLFLLLANCIQGFSQFRFGITAGGNRSSIIFSSPVQIDQAQASHTSIQKALNTYYGGLVFQFKTGKKIVIRPEIEYYKKSWEVNASDRSRINTFRFLRRYDINYLQVPLNVLLTTPLGKGRIYCGAGPYIAFACNGTVQTTDEILDLEYRKFDEPAVTFQQDNIYKPIQFISHYTINRIDYGGNGIIGYEFAFGLFAEAGVGIGLRQISTSYERYDILLNQTIRDSGVKSKYNIFHIGAGWTFIYRKYHPR